MNRLARRKFLVSVLLSAAPALSGQSYNAALVGQVTDPAGLAIQGATITARSNATGRVHRAYTDAAGQYLAGQLEPGVYEVEVSAPGFRTQRELDVSLELDAVQRLDTVLEIGPVTEQVMVREARTALPTDTGSISSAILGSEIANLPLNGRDYRTLALLAPGVAPAPAGANPFHVNGSRADHVSYLLDGLTAMDRRGNQAVVQPPLDSIQEFRVLTNSFSAEYGRIAGGVVSVALKSGSNERHGSLFAFLRNDLFDARGFFDQNAPVLRRNQFGAVVGAPVVRNRVFFMSAYEGLRNRERETRLTRVPTEAERSGAVGRALDPKTGALFPGGQIAPARIDPVASRLLEFFPLPNREGALNYASLGTVSSDRDSGAMRLDFYATSKDHLAGRLVINDARRTSPFRATSLPGFGSVSAARDQFWAVSYTRVLTPSSTNELRFGFGRSQFAENAVNGSRDAGALTGMTGVPPASGLPATTIAGYAPIGDPAPLPDRWTDNEFMVSDTISLVNGRHWIRAGGEVQRSQHFNLFAAYHAGQLVFLGAATRNPIADFLLGAPTATQRQIGTNKSYLFGLTSGMFVQDDWRIHPRLTLNLGIRHDLYRPPVEKYDRWANFIPELGARVLAGDSRFPRSLMRTHWANLAPRLGFAWRPGGGESTVVRGGYGIFYAADLQFTLYQLLGATAYPFTQLEIYQSTPSVPLRLAAPFPEGVTGVDPGAASPNGWEFENPTPYQQQWNITVGRRLRPSFAVEAAYVGSKGTHQSVSLNLNQNIRTPQGTVAQYPGFGRILWQSLEANSMYHSLQLSVRRRFGSVFGFRSAFTWSKAIDSASFGAASRQPQDPLNLRAERGLADFHRGRIWTADGMLVLPVGRGRRYGHSMGPALDAVLGGWRLNSIFRYYDGLPFTPIVSTANQQAGDAVRPDRLGSGELPDPTVQRWFQTADFRAVPADAYRFGNSGRNILFGPSQLTLDLSLFKEFSLGRETRRLQFRLEAFNAPNRANFGQPNPAVDQPSGGAIGTALPGRQLQLALKYLFSTARCRGS